jgi:HIRAN domain
MPKKHADFGLGKMLTKVSKSLFKSATNSFLKSGKNVNSKPETRTLQEIKPKPLTGSVVIDCEGEFLLEIAGAQHHQKQLAELVGNQLIPSSGLFALCQLAREPTNEFDSNAVKVSICSKKVGYLPRDDAEEFQETLKENGIGRAKIFTHARILKNENDLLKVEIDWNDCFDAVAIEDYDRTDFLPMVLEGSENEEPIWVEAVSKTRKVSSK